MATHLKNLNLEEQEQLEQLKGFWAGYGRFIILLAVVLLAVIVGWVGWMSWQNRQGRGAAELYDGLNQAIVNNNAEQAKQVAIQIQSEYGRAVYATQASLVAAHVLYNQGKLDDAKTVLSWATENGRDAGLKALAVVRLADVLTDQKDYDAALKVLSTTVPAQFAALVNDRRGDVYLMQGKMEEAKNAYTQAYTANLLTPDSQGMVAGKLGFLGVDVSTLSAAQEQRS